MSKTFKAGDLCVLLDHPLLAPEYKECVGMQLTLVCFVGFDSGFWRVWESRDELGRTCLADECVLRKVEPPGRELGSWDECPWRPEREVAL